MRNVYYTILVLAGLIGSLSMKAATGIETDDNVSANSTITFSLGEYTDAGVAPAEAEVQTGTTYTLPLNRTLYVEGKTLTAWTDGSNNYQPSEEITVSGNLSLTPVFTDNEVSLNDREEEVTISWDFQRKNGAPTLAYERTTAIYVTQATVNGKVIDVKMNLDATTGKIANGNWSDWAQMNAGTILTIPAAKNCTVSLESYSPTTTTTIAGDINYQLSGNVATYIYGGDAETIDIVIGDGSYFRYFTVVYPKVESNVQERPVYVTDFTDWESLSSNDAPASVNKTTNFSNETLTFTFDGVMILPSGTESKFDPDVKGFARAEKNLSGTITTSTLENITRVRYRHAATGSKRGYKLEKKSATDSDWFVLSDAVADPAGGVWVECNINEKDVQLRWTNLALNQYAFLLDLEIYSNIEITTPQVTLTTNISPEEAGSVSVVPASSQYDEGSEVTLTASKNFGYKFVKWIDAASQTLSTDASYKQILNENMVITAVFEPVATYSLSTSTEGGANDYMITATPEATVVNGKNMYESGTLVKLTATENPILKFTNWKDSENTTTNELSVTMDSDKEFIAVYSASEYIVGWDFIRKGNSNRAADFISTSDNETAALILRTEDGTTQAWLDKSQESGGYEGEPGAVNWKNLTDKYYYETSVNAAAFTDIKVTSRMLYNYNAYSTQKLEYSLDGTEYKEAARITLSAAKTWTPLEATLPEECNNAATLHIRWIPDYDSEIVGSASQNDGTAIGAIYITGKEGGGINPGVPPTLLSSIPANNEIDVTATGRIVLNFDNKVKIADGVIITLGEKELTPVITGKTITLPYMGLDYNTDYTFTLPANSISDLYDNKIAEAITIKFTTIAPPTVTPGMYDAIVSNAEELLAALTRGNAASTSGTRFRIFLHDGTYDLGSLCLTDVKSNISLIGESMENTIIVNKAPAEGISVSATLQPTGENIYMQDITLKNDYDYAGTTGRAVCLQDKGNKNIYKNVRLLSFQDTYYTNNNRMRSYFEDGEIHGTVDFICGGGDVFFNRTLLYLEDRAGNCITAPAGDTEWGYVFNNCIIDGYDSNKGSYALGRPWQGTPKSVWVNTTMKISPKSEGWSDMSVLPALFAEYNSHSESGIKIDCSKRKTVFSVVIGKDDNGADIKEPQTVNYNPELTEGEAARFTIDNVLGGSDSWQPALLTEQATAPILTVDGSTLSWNASNYVFCYAICKNGKVIDFTNETSYTIPADATDEDVFTVRAANQMGGLGQASNASNATGIDQSTVSKEVVECQYYNVNGIRINKAEKGLNIIRTIYSDGTIETIKEFVK
ncbi:pectinesterase family protein [Bacteroides sp.]